MPPPQTPLSAPASLGLGLCGLGLHGVRFARHLLAGDVPGARLAAVCRRNGARGRTFAEEHGIRFHAEPGDLAADPAVDAVVVVLPPDLHPDVTVLALEEGKPVLVDKPVAASVDGARRVVEAAARTGLPVMVGQSLRYDAVVREMKRRVPDLGPLRALALSQRFEPTDREWIDVPGRGGLILNTGVHGIDLARWLSGAEPTQVFAMTERVTTRETEDSFVAVARFDREPLLATLDNCRATASRLGRVEIVGERGQLVGDFVLGTLAEIRGREARPVDVAGPVQTVKAVAEDFVECLRAGGPSPIPPEEGLAGLRSVEALLRSAETGTPRAVRD